MKTRPLGQSGIEASVIAFGAWAVGGWMWGGTDEKESVAAIHAALDHGMNFIDTAPVYGFGRSEEIVGKALAGGYRQKAVLASKCALVWDGGGTDGTFHFEANRDGAATVKGAKDNYLIYVNTRPKQIRKGVEESLRRLRTDVIDLMQTHWQDPSAPVADAMGELMKLKKEGKIRAIGCSNASIGEMDQYRAAGQLDADQEKFNMIDRGMEKTNLPYCAEHNIAFLAYSPLAQGLLTGAIGPDRVFAKGDLRNDDPRYSLENRKKAAEFLAVIKPVADGHGLTLAQLVSAWTVAQPGCTHALLGARNVKQVLENAKGGEIDIDKAGLDLLSKAVAEKLAGVI